ncbi:hypothetical protein EMCRGX_G032759 [Ephydatia muelleri]
MSSLTRRGLISKVGNPARYILTEAGAVLAAKLLEGSAALTDKPVQVPTAPASLREDETASSDDDSASSPEISPPRASIELMSSQSGKSELCFWYVTPEEKCVCRKDQAAVTFNDKLTVGFLVRCSKKLLESSSILYTLDHHRKQVDGMVFAYIANEDAPEIATPPSEGVCGDMEGQGELGKRPKGHVRVDSDDSSDVEEVLPLSERLGLSCAHPLKQHTDIPLACKNVPSVRKDITPVHKDVVSVHKDAPTVHKDAPTVHKVAPTVHKDAPTVHKDAPTVQKDAPTVHKDAPTVHKDAPTVHKDAPTVHKDAPTVHKDAPTVHKDSASVHSTVTSNTIDKTSPSRTNQTYMFESSWTPTERAGLAAIRRNAHDGLTSKMPEVSSHTATTSPSISGMATTSVASSSMSEAMVDLSNPVCVLRPGQFEVVLCVDSSESSSNRRSASQFRGMLLQELGKNGIRFDVRRLNVGDFMWIAKEMVLPQPGQLSLPQSTEIVLEHIVERKRMDDLAFSICDGRFHEQKFRLKQCGVKYPVYLVEDYGSHTHLQLDARALEQAITNTQVIDKFFVKRTKDLRGSVEYLTLLTRYLQKYYVGKTLKAYPLDTVLLQNKCEKPSDPTVLYSTLFEEFNTASLKNKVLTTYEMFAMHLIPLAGVSAEKAHAILEVFPTVASLRHAYKQCLSEKERENLISDIRAGQGQRRVGPAISRLIYTLYWKS